MKRTVKLRAKDGRDTITIRATITSSICRDDMNTAAGDLGDKLMLLVPDIKYVGVALRRCRIA